LSVVQRKIIPSNRSFTPIHSMSCPFVVFFDKTETNKQLYIRLWNMCKRFLSNDNDTARDSKTSTSDSSDSEKPIIKPTATFSRVDLDFNNLPFYISAVSGGVYCKHPQCRKKDCNGCKIEPDDNSVYWTDKDNGNTLAITWATDAVKYLWKKTGFSASFKLHKSVEELRAKGSECTLNDCLKLFTKNEQLGPEDPWYCPTCKVINRLLKSLTYGNYPIY